MNEKKFSGFLDEVYNFLAENKPSLIQRAELLGTIENAESTSKNEW